MFFNSWTYIIFLFISFLFFWFCIPAKYRLAALILYGAIFYAFYSVSFLFLIIILALVTYFGALKLQKTKSKMDLFFSVSLVVGVLIFFKYSNLFLLTLRDLGFQTPVLHLLMPLGISFFIFEFVHYLVDVYSGKINEVNFKNFFAFILFFPTLVSGPIKRYEQFEIQVRSIVFEPKYLYYGVLLIILGYAEKYFIADNLIDLTKGLAESTLQLTSPLSILKQLYCYSFRIFFDFSGLTNIATGSALLFGIIVPKNFNYPYFSANMTEFWQRWHISLSNWFRDYVFVPIALKKITPARLYMAILLVFTLSGLWHGANWTFAVWGLWNGFGVLVHKLFRKFYPIKKKQNLFKKTICIFLTFNFVTIGWVFFASPSLHNSFLMIQRLFRL